MAQLDRVWSELVPSSAFDVVFLDQHFDQLYRAEERFGSLFGYFSALAIIIACLGLLGLASYTAEQRTKEIGIRKVMGASTRSIIGLLTRDYSLLVVFSFIFAVPLAYIMMGRWLENFAYQSGLNVMTFAIAGVSALLIAWITVGYQALRAAVSDPVLLFGDNRFHVRIVSYSISKYPATLPRIVHPEPGLMDEGLVTQLLSSHRGGDSDASERLFEIVYDELRQLAHRQLRYRKPGETLNTTGLVHEAYLKMFDREDADWKDRAHFFAVTARAMRHILVDYARRVNAEKRGGKAHRTDLHASLIQASDNPVDVLDLDDALKQLSELNPKLSQIVEYRFFGGLNIEETAEVMGMSSRSVDRGWYKAKSFLYLALSDQDA